MYAHRLATVALLALAFTCLVARTAEDYAPEGGGFSVTPPPEAPKITVQSKKVPSDVGELLLTLHIWDMGTKATMISVNEYPAKFWEAADPKAAMDGGQAKAVGDGKLISSKDVEVNGLKARDFIFEKPNGAGKLICRDMIILVKPKMYQVLCIGPTQEYVTSEELNKTFSSFKLTK